LLIAPNAESALNEEAGKLILEDYSAYFDHAKLWTSLHAMNTITDVLVDGNKRSESIENIPCSTSPVKRVMDAAPKTEKKRSIRRL